MHEQLWFTEILNHAFGATVTSVMQILGFHPKYPQAPIPNSVAMEILVCAFLIVVFFIVRARLSVDQPGALQHSFEVVVGFIEQQSHEIIGAHSEGYTPFLVSLALFILFSNLLGLFPGFESPTAVPPGPVPLGCAIVAFFYYQAQGFKHAGPKYLLHFFGPPMEGVPLVGRIPLALLMLLIEIASHLARVLSLTIRLFANMFAGDMVTLVFFSLVPLGVPILFLGLHIGVSFLQTYIFVLLTTVYLAGAVAEEH
jgi:F-type H+-transporting ATPase subunit a